MNRKKISNNKKEVDKFNESNNKIANKKEISNNNI